MKALPEEGVFSFNILCDMQEGFHNPCPDPVYCSLHNSDLERLVKYIDDHRLALLNRTWTASEIYMPLEADFALQCLLGEIISPNNGGFAIRIMLNLQVVTDTSSNHWVGFESSLDVREANSFTNAVTQLRQSSPLPYLDHVPQLVS